MGTRFGEPGVASSLPLNGCATLLKLLRTSHRALLCKGYGLVLQEHGHLPILQGRRTKQFQRTI